MLKNKRVLKLVAVLTVMVMSIFMLTGCEIGSSSKKSNNEQEIAVSSFEIPIKNIVEGLSEANAGKFLSAFPSFMSEPMKNIFTDEYLQGTLDETKEEFGDNLKMAYNVTKKEEIDADELREMEEEIKNNFDKEITIEEGYIVDVEITTKGDLKEEKEDSSFEIYKIAGSWYIMNL